MNRCIRSASRLHAIAGLLPAALATALTLSSCLAPTTAVVGQVIGGGRGALEPHEVQFEQNGEVVATTTTHPPAQTFEILLYPGAYVVTVYIQGGCPRTPVTIQGSRTELEIQCNAL
jgi:hypothetical protein